MGDEVKQRIMDNIADEAKNYVERGTSMTIRGPEWTPFIDAALAEAKKLYTFKGKKRKGLTPVQRLEKKQQRLAAKQGISWDEWRKIANSLYSIDPVTYVVTSIAKGPNYKKTWTAISEIDAQETIYKLIYYKHYDHFEREDAAVNFAYIPPSKEDRKKAADEMSALDQELGLI